MYKSENGMYSSSSAVDVGLVQYPTENRLVPHRLDVQDSPCVLKIRTAWIIMNEGESVVGGREATIADPGNDFTGSGLDHVFRDTPSRRFPCLLTISEHHLVMITDEQMRYNSALRIWDMHMDRAARVGTITRSRRIDVLSPIDNDIYLDSRGREYAL